MPALWYRLTKYYPTPDVGYVTNGDLTSTATVVRKWVQAVDDI